MKKLFTLIAAVFALSAIASADSFTTYSTRAAQNPTDIIDWSQLGPANTLVSTPALITTFNGNLALAGNINGGAFVRVDNVPGSWAGNFDYGENLVWTGNPNFGVGGGGPFAVELGTPVSSFGFAISADLYGAFTATVQVYDTMGHLLTTRTFSGISNGNFDGSALFIGLGDNAGVNIGGFIISTDSGNPLFANDFAIDDVSLSQTPLIPEPTTLVMLGSGLIGLAGAARRKLLA